MQLQLNLSAKVDSKMCNAVGISYSFSFINNLKVVFYLKSTDATFPIPSKRAPLVRRLAMKLRNSVSASVGKFVSSKVRL